MFKTRYIVMIFFTGFLIADVLQYFLGHRELRQALAIVGTDAAVILFVWKVWPHISRWVNNNF